MTKPVCGLLVFFQVITYIPAERAKFIGGTVSTIPRDVLGTFEVKDEKLLSFKWDETGEWRIPYAKVTSVSYGQHAGRRVGATIATAVATAPLLGIPALPLLFSKKRRHYLTIEYSDEQEKAQAAIFLVGKKAIRETLKILEIRTGKNIRYEDEEARQSGNR